MILFLYWPISKLLVPPGRHIFCQTGPIISVQFLAGCSSLVFVAKFLIFDSFGAGKTE
jgi:hypothetical protein